MIAYSPQDPSVDVLILSRPHCKPPTQVIQAIQDQVGVAAKIHCETGWPKPADANRWATIARGRNALKRQASAAWALFIDDDVVLAPDGAKTLVDELTASPSLGALAADYQGERLSRGYRGHVTMGACLFRKSVLEKVSFRSTGQACECQCCCNDLRALGLGIAYSSRARATHLRPKQIPSAVRQSSGHSTSRSGIVMAAFDRRDIPKFRHQFLRSLRAWGNEETVVAVTYGLYPSEIRSLSGLSGVQVIPRPYDGRMVPVRRLNDFAEVTSKLPAATPTAYWDVADVVFQSSLQPLWQRAATQPDKLLAVAEPKGYPQNAVIPAWSLSIHSARHRRQAFELLRRNPFLNSGFAAGTASTMHQYFSAAARFREGPELDGTTDWGDQMCLNLYCHSQPDRWQAIDESWNYCVHDRPRGQVYVTTGGVVCSRGRGRVPVVHGNARSLRQFGILV